MSSNTKKTNHLPTKEELIERINQIDNPSELLRLRVFFDNEDIDEEQTNEGVDEYSKMIDEVLAIYKQKDEPLLIHQELPAISKLQILKSFCS